MGTISGINSRRYHGHLVAAIVPPTERMALLAAVDAFVIMGGEEVGLSANEYVGAVFPDGYTHLNGFSAGSVIEWRYRVENISLVKRLQLTRGANEATVSYTNTGRQHVSLVLRPLVCHKPYHENFVQSEAYPANLTFDVDSTVVSHGGIELVIDHPGSQRTPMQCWYYRFEHARERERGLDPRDDLYCPCELLYKLAPGETVQLGARGPAVASSGECSQDARSFLVHTKDRTSIIAGYPWFTDWGRDTMISLPGLCLRENRVGEARQIILDYCGQMRQGLIPNRFVDSGEAPEYNTVDATLWMVNAAYLSLEAEWSQEFAQQFMAACEEIFQWHLQGTWYGIGVDPADGLLSQGSEGVQLTWMDAKIGDWVVTPRRGKPVEINGLWINALAVMAWLADKLSLDAAPYKSAQDKALANFDDAFWSETCGWYRDTADPADIQLRPNQLIAMGLQFGPAKGARALRALESVEQHLLTPRGVRTLAPFESGYRGRYEGPLPELDSAYHQGTVWPWLWGPYAWACRRLRGANPVLSGIEEMLTEYGIGGIAEVYDGDAPHRPGGCPWQAWSFACLAGLMEEQKQW